METIYGGGYPNNTGPSENIDRAENGVFSTGWASFKREWESIKLDWEPVERELKTMDRESRERFVERAKEAAVRLKAIIGSE